MFPNCIALSLKKTLGEQSTRKPKPLKLSGPGKKLIVTASYQILTDEPDIRSVPPYTPGEWFSLGYSFVFVFVYHDGGITLTTAQGKAKKKTKTKQKQKTL